MLFLALFLGIMLCTAQGDKEPPASEPVGMTMGALKPVFLPANPESSQAPPDPVVAPTSLCCGVDELKQLLSQLTQDQREAASWRGEVVKVLSQLVQEHREVSSGQREVVKLLKAMKDQGAQHLNDLQNLGRHQSLLVENHQALLLQVSRISTHLQDLAKKPNAASQ